MTSERPEPTSSEAALESEALRIEQLLEEVRKSSGPHVWRRIEELVAALMTLHGAGLTRLLEVALGDGLPAEGRTARIDAICDDALLSGLLVLHDLHPAPPEQRLGRALAQLAPALADEGVTLDFVRAANRTVTFRAAGADLADKAALVRRAAAHAAEALGGDVERIEIEGLPTAATPALIPADRLARGAAR